jgi:hypothetical protein
MGEWCYIKWCMVKIIGDCKKIERLAEFCSASNV